MEDIVIGGENLLHPENPSSIIAEIEEAEQADNHKKEDDNEQKAAVDEGKGEEKGGGLLNHLLSNLVSPLSPKAGEGTQPVNINGNEGYGAEEHIESSPSSGGLIKNVLSNFFHLPNETDEEKRQNEKNNEEETVKIVEKTQHEKQKTEEDGGASIIDNIVSHLPTSLPGKI